MGALLDRAARGSCGIVHKANMITNSDLKITYILMTGVCAAKKVRSGGHWKVNTREGRRVVS